MDSSDCSVRMSYSYLIPYYFVSLTLNNSATSECLYPHSPSHTLAHELLFRVM